MMHGVTSDVYLCQRLLTSVLFACITRCVLIYVRTVFMSLLHNPVYYLVVRWPFSESLETVMINNGT